MLRKMWHQVEPLLTQKLLGTCFLIAAVICGIFISPHWISAASNFWFLAGMFAPIVLAAVGILIRQAADQPNPPPRTW